MRAPSTILRSLPLWKLQSRASAAVAPLPEETRFGRELTAVLDTLLSQGSNEIGLAQFLDAAITTQKTALNSLSEISYRDEFDRGSVDLYLETNVEALDLCNYFVDKIDQIKRYVESLRVVSRLVGVCGNAKANSRASARALELLDSSCESIMGKHGSSCLRKMLKQKLSHDETEFSEVMCGSKAMALVCCMFLELGLSFDDSKLVFLSMKNSQPTSSVWLRLLHELAKGAEMKKKVQKKRCGSNSLLMNELQQTVIAARELKEHMKGKRVNEIYSAAERLKMRCNKLEDGLEIIEERVKDLYKCLIDVRMALLGILSQAHIF